MRLLIQRVRKAAVMIDGRVHSSIDEGLLVFAGIGREDESADVSAAADKLVSLRIFEDSEGKMNRSILEHGGSMLLVSQFTLSADLTRGNRPSFDSAMKSDEAEKIYGRLKKELSERVHTESGVFGAVMDIESVNHGPATFIMEIKC